MAMRVGIPLFEDEVSPRFCFAPRMLVVTLDDAGAVAARETVDLGPAWLPGRVALLAEQKIGLLLCGGFNADFLPQAERLGVRVVCGLSGPAEQCLERLLAGELPATADPCRGRRAGGRRCKRNDR